MSDSDLLAYAVNKGKSGFWTEDGQGNAWETASCTDIQYIHSIQRAILGNCETMEYVVLIQMVDILA